MSRTTLFISALKATPSEKGEALLSAETPRQVMNADDFSSLPNAPFAYWLTPGLRSTYKRLKSLGSQANAVVGLQTSDDYRFLRLWWEINNINIKFSIDSTFSEASWVFLNKGGRAEKYYSDIYLVINWSRGGQSVKDYASKVNSGKHWTRNIRSHEMYFRPGVTWPLRTSKLTFRPMPAGCIFSNKGSTIFVESDDINSLSDICSIGNSTAFLGLTRALIARTELAQSYEVGVISSVPLPEINQQTKINEKMNFAALGESSRSIYESVETSHAFCYPGLIKYAEITVSRRFSKYQSFLLNILSRSQSIQDESDEIAFELYGFSEEDRALIRSGLAAGIAAPIPELEEDAESQDADFPVPDDADEDDDEEEAEAGAVGSDLATLSQQLLSWCVGVAFGRWDVRMALDPTLIPALQGPFERLPVVAPAGLVGVDGYPAVNGEVAPVEWLRARPNVITLPEGEWHNTPEYPLPVAWDGVLVSDHGHPRDLAARVRQVLALVFGEQAGTYEDDLLAAIRGAGRRPGSLDEYLRNPKFFFDTHLKGYSRSRRKAPIYWPLMHPDAPGFVVWLYAPAITGQTLARVLTDVVLPRLELARADVSRLQGDRVEAGSKASGRQLEQAEDFARGLGALAAELRRVVDLGYEPWPDDGTLLSASPLHAIIPWRDLLPAFRALQAGKYPWAHLHTRWAAAPSSE